MNQTRLESFVEAWVNVFIGFSINYVANLIILPAVLGVSLSHSANLVIGLIFTVISVARSYAIRRWFNAGLHKMVKNTAAKLITWRIFGGESSTSRG